MGVLQECRLCIASGLGKAYTNGYISQNFLLGGSKVHRLYARCAQTGSIGLKHCDGVHGRAGCALDAKRVDGHHEFPLASLSTSLRQPFEVGIIEYP
jgi:hypothetical protein